jgi:hypothetical protein
MDTQIILGELKVQRARIAGDDGWCWTDGYPRFEKECCALFYRDGSWVAAEHMSEDACNLIAIATLERFEIPRDKFSMVDFNDGDPRCTPEVLIEIFDAVIAELEKNT